MDERIFVGLMFVLLLLGGCGSKKVEPVASTPLPVVEPAKLDSKPVSPAVDEETDAIDISDDKELSSVVIHTDKEDLVIEVEIADTAEERERGLMGRDSLSPNTGMLFVFDSEEQVSFHMLNVSFMVDVLFIGADFEVKNFAIMVPCRNEPCPVWNSRDRVKYALELPGGFVKENKVSRGNKISIV